MGGFKDSFRSVDIQERGRGILAPFVCSVRTKIEINAMAEGVWSILTNASKYAAWNPFIREIEGTMDLGQQLRVGVGEGTGNLLYFDVKITKLNEPHELCWSSRYGLPWLIDTRHSFMLEALGNGRARLHHGEAFWGVLVPKMVRPGLDSIAQGFDLMNNALKANAEAERCG